MTKILKNLTYTALVSLLFLPIFVFAQFEAIGGDGELDRFGTDIVDFINSSLVPLVFAIALLLFIYGMFLYFITGAENDEKRKTGKSYILWSIIALVIMVSVWGITNLIAGGLGFSDTTEIGTPSSPGTR